MALAAPVPRRDRTRAALLRAGQKLFAERPIDIISIDDIVQAAEVGRGSFYNHFEDKEAFERAIVVDARREMEQTIAATVAGETDPARRTALSVCVSVRFGHDHPDRARLVVREFIGGHFMESDTNAGLLRDISEGIVAGCFTVPTAELGVLTVLGLANAAMVRAMELPDLLSKITLGAQIAAVILRALGVPAEVAAAQASYCAEVGIRAPQQERK